MIIKNPQRLTTEQQVLKYSSVAKRETYQPEYLRFGLDPHSPFSLKQQKAVEEKMKQDFQMALTERRKQEKKMAETLPKQVKVNSGINQEQIWLPPQAKYFDEELSSAPDSVWFDPEKSVESLEQEESLSGNEQFLDEDISFTEEGLQALTEATNPDEINLEITDTPESQYCVMVNGKVIAIAENKEEAENVVDFAAFSKQTPFQSTSLEDVAVFQRIKIKRISL